MSEVNNRKTILIISQTFVPDPAAVGWTSRDLVSLLEDLNYRCFPLLENGAPGFCDCRRLNPARLLAGECLLRLEREN